MIIYDFVRKGARSTVGMKVERFGGNLAKVGVSLACITIEDLVKGRTRRGSGELVLRLVNKLTQRSELVEL